VPTLCDRFVEIGTDTIRRLTDSAYPPRVLHEVSTAGGLGFCHAALPDLLAPGYHGPLVVALDSNVLIDLQEHGSEMLNDDIQVADEKYAEELQCLGTLLNLWMLRDIRFVVTPRARTDAKRDLPGFDRLIDGLAESLAFQYGDWSYPAPQNGPRPSLVGGEHGLPEGADRDLVLEAQAVGAQVFLTRDRRVLRQAALTGPAMRIWAPSELADDLVIAGVEPMRGGTCGAPGCPYGDSMLLLPDIGKWGPLLAHFEDE
jgi:hypothetical protein